MLGGGYVYPDYARGSRGGGEWVVAHRQGQPFLEQIFPETATWGTTPGSVGSVGSGEEAAPGQDINVLGGGYVFPSYARSYRGAGAFPPGSFAGQLGVLPSSQPGVAGMVVGQQAKAQMGQQLLIPRASTLWGGQYSSVGKFPKGYNGQV